MNLDDDVYEIPSSLIDSLPTVWATKRAEETPATRPLTTTMDCPYCGETIRSVHVSGLKQTKTDSGTAASLVVTCPVCAAGLSPEILGR
ncbi:MAG TPA: hypothetical protein VKH42_20755 [Vicinamibacterales bacterium]|nr:hypothetical protein [Vicinamibacterales bacterium]